MAKRYAYNTSATQVKKRYAMIGSTATQVKKRYAMIGSTATLVYSAQSPDQSYILNLDDQKTDYTGGWALSNQGGYAYLQGYSSSTKSWEMSYSANNQYGRGWMTTKQKVDISGWSKLSLTLSYYEGYGDAYKTAGKCYLAICTDNAYHGFSANMWDYTLTSTSGIVRSSTAQCGDGSGSRTITVDVSGLDGSYYIQIGRANAADNKTFTSQFKTVYFS